MNTAVRWKVKVLVSRSCPALCGPTDYSPAGSSVHGILRVWTLQWAAMPFSWGSSQLRDRTQVSTLQVDSLLFEPPGKSMCVCVCVCVCVYTLSHEKEWDNAIRSSMDEPRDDRGKWSQTKANTIWYHLYVECKKINEIIYKTEQTHRHRMQTYGYQRGKRREEVNEDFGINIDKLLYIK